MSKEEIKKKLNSKVRKKKKKLLLLEKHMSMPLSIIL